MAQLTLTGTIRRSEPDGQRKTVGKFSNLVNDNADVFARYFGIPLFPGSLNVDVLEPPLSQHDLDRGKYPPAIVIPRTELVGMPDYIGDGQAWRCILAGEKLPEPASCWIFRRIGSRVPQGVLEIVAGESLSKMYGLRDGDPVCLTMQF